MFVYIIACFDKNDAPNKEKKRERKLFVFISDFNSKMIKLYGRCGMKNKERKREKWRSIKIDKSISFFKGFLSRNYCIKL